MLKMQRNTRYICIIKYFIIFVLGEYPINRFSFSIRNMQLFFVNKFVDTNKINGNDNVYKSFYNQYSKNSKYSKIQYSKNSTTYMCFTL